MTVFGMNVNDLKELATVVGTVLGVGGAASLAAYKGSSKVWRNGLRDLFRPVVVSEVKRAFGTLSTDIQSTVRQAMHEETEDLRRDIADLSDDLKDTRARVQRLEEAHPPKDA